MGDPQASPIEALRRASDTEEAMPRDGRQHIAVALAHRSVRLIDAYELELVSELFDTPHHGLHAGDLDAAVMVRCKAGLDNAVRHVEFVELVAHLANQDVLVHQEQRSIATLHGLAEDRRGDHGLTVAGHSLQEN